MFSHMWYSDEKLSKKYVYSNCYRKLASKTKKTFLLRCDNFTSAFSVCDHFNRSLHDKSWPYRFSSVDQSIHNFHFTSLLINVLNIHTSFHDLLESSFQDFALNLANSFFRYACTLDR